MLLWDNVIAYVSLFFQNQLYTVQVNAYDFGDPAKTSSVLVYFNVKDTNDNTPVFEQGIYDVAIVENVTIGTSVVQVQAPDIDAGKLRHIEQTLFPLICTEKFYSILYQHSIQYSLWLIQEYGIFKWVSPAIYWYWKIWEMPIYDK